MGPVQGGQCHGRGLPRRHIPHPVLSLHPLLNILHSWASSVPGDTVTLFLVTLWGVEAWSRHHPACVVWQQGNPLLLDRGSVYSTLSHALPSWTLITPQGGWETETVAELRPAPEATSAILTTLGPFPWTLGHFCWVRARITLRFLLPFSHVLAFTIASHHPFFLCCPLS